MAKVTRSFQVKSKPEAVIDYIADVENHPAFIPPLKSVANIAGDPKRQGTRWDWAFVMAGVENNGKAGRWGGGFGPSGWPVARSAAGPGRRTTSRERATHSSRPASTAPSFTPSSLP